MNLHLFRTCRAASVFIAAIAFAPLPTLAQSLLAGSWGGDYAQAQQLGALGADLADKGLTFNLANHQGDPAVLDRTDVQFSLIDLERHQVAAACDAGKLQPLDEAAVIDADDFLPGLSETCGLPSVGWSRAVTLNPSLFPDGAPLSIADVFAADLFPGKRGLPRSPQGTLELALLSVGVMPDEIYGALQTADGLQLAFDRLSEIWPQIVWYDSDAEALARFRNKDVAISLLYNSQVAPLAAGRPSEATLLPDAQLIEFSYWAIPANTPDAAKSQALLTELTSAEVLAATADLLFYGPARTSAITAMGPAGAASPAAQLDKGLLFDKGWWAANGASVQAAFDVWYSSQAAAAQ